MWVRTANERDVTAINRLLVETWHDTYDAIYGADRVDAIVREWHAIPALIRRLTLQNSEFIVADTGDAIVGVAFALCADEKTVDLRQLYVRPEAQGQGIGRALLTEIERCFPEAIRVRLEVEPANRKAIGFYRSKGFVEVGRTDHCGTPGSDIAALIFEKPLQ